MLCTTLACFSTQLWSLYSNYACVHEQITRIKLNVWKLAKVLIACRDKQCKVYQMVENSPQMHLVKLKLYSFGE